MIIHPTGYADRAARVLSVVCGACRDAQPGSLGQVSLILPCKITSNAHMYKHHMLVFFASLKENKNKSSICLNISNSKQGSHTHLYDECLLGPIHQWCYQVQTELWYINGDHTLQISPDTKKACINTQVHQLPSFVSVSNFCHSQ